MHRSLLPSGNATAGDDAHQDNQDDVQVMGERPNCRYNGGAGRAEPLLFQERLSYCKYKSLFSTENFRIFMMRKFRLSVLGKL